MIINQDGEKNDVLWCNKSIPALNKTRFKTKVRRHKNILQMKLELKEVNLFTNLPLNA